MRPAPLSTIFTSTYLPCSEPTWTGESMHLAAERRLALIPQMIPIPHAGSRPNQRCAGKVTRRHELPTRSSCWAPVSSADCHLKDLRAAQERRPRVQCESAVVSARCAVRLRMRSKVRPEWSGRDFSAGTDQGIELDLPLCDWDNGIEE